jgi:hypothetical protein
MLFFKSTISAAEPYLTCNANLFSFQTNPNFTIQLGLNINSYIKYPSTNNELAKIKVLHFQLNPGVYSIYTSANEAEALYMKVNLHARSGEMILLFDEYRDMEDNNKATLRTGSCELKRQ